MGRLTAVVAWGLGHTRGAKETGQNMRRVWEEGRGRACLGRPARYGGRAPQLYRTVAAWGPGCSPGGVAPRPGPAGERARGGRRKGSGRVGLAGEAGETAGPSRPGQQGER